jgi:hypothetical protein
MKVRQLIFNKESFPQESYEVEINGTLSVKLIPPTV